MKRHAAGRAANSRYARDGLSPSDSYRCYEAIFAGIEAPFAFVDLDAMWSNAEFMLARRNGKPIRIASKSIRCRAILERIFARDDAFRGILSFTLPEALFLADAGHANLLVAYPTTDRGAIGQLAALAAENSERAPILMVDEVAQLDLIEGSLSDGPAKIRVCIDLDLSWRPLGRRAVTIGPKRSPIRTPEAAAVLAREIVARPGLQLDGVMGYGGQVAGVGDDAPGAPMRNAVVRAMQRASSAEFRSRRAAIVEAIREVTELRFVNAGGTDNLEAIAAEDAVTELSAGSGFYAPALFDGYRSLDLRPAAAFALPVVRRPDAGIATALGGGYVASGPVGGDRLPAPYLPAGLKLDRREGAGEVQTPLVGPAAGALRVGDRVYLRHAKAGELCERFNALYLIEGEKIVDEVPTYRGEGKAFL